MEEGRRLENLSWRLWNRETFCCDSKPKFPDTPTGKAHTTRPSFLSKKQAPALSTSVDSVASVEEGKAEDTTRATRSIPIPRSPPSKSITDGFSSGRSRCKPISSYTLEKMVIDIKNTKINDRDDLNALSTSLTDSLPTVSIKLDTVPSQVMMKRQSIQRTSQSSTASTAPIPSSSSTVERSQTFESDTSADIVQSHSIVRGFAPNKISSAQRSTTNLMAGRSPVPIKSALRNGSTSYSSNNTANLKANFTLGGSSDDESSFDDSRSLRPSASPMVSGSRFPQQLQSKQHHTPKMTTFREEVEIRRDHSNEGAIDSDDSDADSDLSESAIEEEDDAWEDDLDNQSDRDQGLFQRVSSKLNLVSRRSLLTTGLHESERVAALTAQASKPQPSLSQPSIQFNLNPKDQANQRPQPSGISRSKPMAMAIPISQANCALSPRTTRRNMLSTELTESLRQNLLWERQFKNTTAHAFLKRRHTAHENLSKISKLPNPDQDIPAAKASWNDVFTLNNEYNSRGW